MRTDGGNFQIGCGKQTLKLLVRWIKSCNIQKQLTTSNLAQRHHQHRTFDPYNVKQQYTMGYDSTHFMHRLVLKGAEEGEYSRVLQALLMEQDAILWKDDKDAHKSKALDTRQGIFGDCPFAAQYTSMPETKMKAHPCIKVVGMAIWISWNSRRVLMCMPRTPTVRKHFLMLFGDDWLDSPEWCRSEISWRMQQWDDMPAVGIQMGIAKYLTGNGAKCRCQWQLWRESSPQSMQARPFGDGEISIASRGRRCGGDKSRDSTTADCLQSLSTGHGVVLGESFSVAHFIRPVNGDSPTSTNQLF